jgi:hypothetical protein
LPASPRRNSRCDRRQSGRSSGVEHNLAKVGVEGSNPFARSRFPTENQHFSRDARPFSGKAGFQNKDRQRTLQKQDMSTFEAWEPPIVSIASSDYDANIMGTPNRDEAYDKLLTALLGRVLDMLRFAEAKNAALLAFASAWIVGIVNLLSSGKPIPPGYHGVCLAALPLFIIAATVAIASLLPKLQTSTFTGDAKGQFQNLLFFGDIADMTVDGFRNDVRDTYRQTDDAPTDAYLRDLEAQIAINSQIARRKHRMFNVGAMAALIAIALFSVPTVGVVLNAIGGWISR